jgi:hypothetical protein
MICSVYWRNGGFILVPDCIRASHAVEQSYGPLRYCGRLDTERLRDELGASIESDLDAQLFAALSPELATRLGYEAIEDLPLPQGFSWQEGDWWTRDGDLSLLRDGDPPTLTASIVRAPHGGWLCTTNRHRPWAFQGTWVCGTRAAAVQYVAMWAADHARALRTGTEGLALVNTPSSTRPAARLPE